MTNAVTAGAQAGSSPQLAKARRRSNRKRVNTLRRKRQAAGRAHRVVLASFTFDDVIPPAVPPPERLFTRRGGSRPGGGSGTARELLEVEPDRAQGPGTHRRGLLGMCAPARGARPRTGRRRHAGPHAANPWAKRDSCGSAAAGGLGDHRVVGRQATAPTQSPCARRPVLLAPGRHEARPVDSPRYAGPPPSRRPKGEGHQAGELRRFAQCPRQGARARG
jgi:hypothetical protein